MGVLGQDRLPVAVAWLRTPTRACNYGSCGDRNVPNLHLEKPSIKQKKPVCHSCLGVCPMVEKYKCLDLYNVVK